MMCLKHLYIILNTLAILTVFIHGNFMQWIFCLILAQIIFVSNKKIWKTINKDINHESKDTEIEFE